MTILTATQNRARSKLVGVLLPLRIHSYMCLYTTAKGITKATIFKELILDWVSQKKEGDTDEKLVQEIIHKVQLKWKLQKSMNPGLDISTYKNDIEAELEGKGIAPNYIEKIIQEINK